MTLDRQLESNFWGELRALGQQGQEIWKFLTRRQKYSLGAALGLMAIVGFTTASIPVILGKLVDAIVTGRLHGLTQTLPYLITLAVAYLVRESLQVVRKVVVESTCTAVEKEVSINLVSRLLKTNLESLAAQRVGALHGRLHRSIEGLVRSIKLSFLDFFPVAFIALFSLAAVVLRKPVLGALMGAVIPIGAYIVMRQLRSEKGVRIDLLRLKERMDGTIVEQLGGIEYVRAADTHGQEIQRIGLIAEQLRRKEFRHHIAMALYDCWKALNEGGFHILVIAISIAMALSGAISTGEILTFSVLFMGIITPLREVHRILDEAHESSLRVADLLAMLGEPVDQSFDDRRTEEPLLSDEIPLLEAENLRVDYGLNGKRIRALDGISLSIRHGEVIGVAGLSGSGKSTLLRALLRLTHPSGGTLKLGGVPISEVSREAIGRLIGFVSQTPFLFSGTIAENIAYGCPGASLEDVKRAAALARIDEEILAMPNGYESLVAERGQNLSGGQRQRLALARIFLKNPPVLILDEATAALDNLNEHAVLEALAAAMAGRSVIIVAHRLSTLRDTNRIFVFDAGRIVEVGSFDQLLRNDGLFARLARGTVGQSEARQNGGDWARALASNAGAG